MVHSRQRDISGNVVKSKLRLPNVSIAANGQFQDTVPMLQLFFAKLTIDSRECKQPIDNTEAEGG